MYERKILTRQRRRPVVTRRRLPRAPLPAVSRVRRCLVGPPPDDATAIHETERLRAVGPTFVVVARPAFWWLDHYTGLHRYLRSASTAVRETEHLVVFDLRNEGRAG
jgi:hypothetical protein